MIRIYGMAWGIAPGRISLFCQRKSNHHLIRELKQLLQNVLESQRVIENTIPYVSHSPQLGEVVPPSKTASAM